MFVCYASSCTLTKRHHTQTFTHLYLSHVKADVAGQQDRGKPATKATREAFFSSNDTLCCDVLRGPTAPPSAVTAPPSAVGVPLSYSL